MQKSSLETEKDLDSGIPALFKNKVFLIVAGAILFLALVASIYSAITLNNRVEAELIALESNSNLPNNIGEDVVGVAEVLPQQRRESDEQISGNGQGPFIDPFAEPMKLTGIAIGGHGGNMAIIESGGTSYIVSVGDYVDDLWAVTKITRDSAVLRAHNQEVSLFFDQPPVTRSLDLVDLNIDENDAAVQSDGEEGDS
jgi:type II secretory pathway component PulC